MDNNNYYNDENSQSSNGGQENYNPYSYNPYNYSDDNYGSEAPVRRRSGKKKSRSFGKTMGKTVAVALVFGLVAGTAYTGVSYAGSKILGTSKKSAVVESIADGATEDSSTSSVKSTASGYAADLTDVSEIAEEVMPSIVAITNTSTVTYQSFWGQTSSYQSESCGSGIIIGEDDEYLYIATNNHVVSGAESLSVQFSDESVVDTAETRGTYESGDLAVVMVKKADISSDTLNTIKIATIGDSSELKVGEPTIAIGNALGYGQSVTTGIVSALGRSVTTSDSSSGTTYTHDNLIQTDAAINPGNSGGALLNKNGEVIGINSVKYSSTEVEGIGYAIPMEDAYPIIQSLIESGSYVDTSAAYLGISGQDITSAIAQTYNMPEGIYVYSVYSGSGAANAGLKQGDIITQIDDTEVSTMDELKAALKNYSAGDTPTFTVYRQSDNGYKGYTVQIELMSADQIEGFGSSSTTTK